MKVTTRILLALLIGAVAFALRHVAHDDGGKAASPAADDRSFAARAGTVFTDPPADPLRAPRVAELSIPGFPTANAIWGATGRDDRGHLWFGVSERSGRHSGRLFEYVPDSGAFHDRGNALEQLERLGRRRGKQRQSKIHSKIVAADDGYLYFSSMDEQGADARGKVMPRWGSHLWRILPGETVWEHLFEAPEGLVAVSGFGRWIYALGYWDHVLYQFDTVSRRIRSTRVGSVDGHISRNFITDARGHAFVPKLLRAAIGDAGEPGLLVTALTELDTRLQEVASTPLIHYAEDEKPSDNEGIIGFVHLADRSIVFATHRGHLYRILPATDEAAEVVSLGWFHPRGAAYTPSLFTYAGRRYIVGLGRRERGIEWLVHDLSTGKSTAAPFEYPGRERKLSVYGSLTRDDRGRFYLVGRQSPPDRKERTPLIFQLQP